MCEMVGGKRGKEGRRERGFCAERGDVEPIVVVLVNHPRTKLFSSREKKTSLLACARESLVIGTSLLI